MDRRFQLVVGGVSLCVLFALSGCGTTGTSTGGSIQMSTDHTTYQSGDTIQVSVTNHLQTSIFAYDTLASCTILGLQAQVNGAWQNSKAARCALGRMARLVEIAAGKTYQAGIRAGIPGVQSSGFPAGSYRFVLTYTTLPQKPQSMTTIYSALITVT